MNVSTPGSAVLIAAVKPAAVETDWRVGRSPVASDHAFTWAGAVSQSRNFSAELTCAAPLLKITQLSGPEMVWCPAPVPGYAGITCTPSCTFGNADRSHGPVTSIPILPELNRLAYAESVGSRYIEWSVTAMVRSVSSDVRPAGESNAALVFAALSIWPPAAQSSASQCQTVSSEPGVT